METSSHQQTSLNTRRVFENSTPCRHTTTTSQSESDSTGTGLSPSRPPPTLHANRKPRLVPVLLTGRPAANQRFDDFARTAPRSQENPLALDYPCIREPTAGWRDTQGEVRMQEFVLLGLGGSFLLSQQRSSEPSCCFGVYGSFFTYSRLTKSITGY